MNDRRNRAKAPHVIDPNRNISHTELVMGKFIRIVVLLAVLLPLGLSAPGAAQDSFL